MAGTALLAPLNDGRHGGRGAESALLTALPPKVACAEAALGGLGGITAGGRHVVRTGLLERSRLGAHVT